MIPIAVFVIIWLVFLAIFMVVASLSLMQMFRFGVRDPITKWSIIIFVGLSIVVIGGTLLYLAQIDMQASLDIRPFAAEIFPT
ncbi:hypothetical protein GF391_02900 [Candidatus Uhrbacteria bacterium]|nr:hypothetical protein [Candidatus Uhrbacteria bacterium]